MSTISGVSSASSAWQIQSNHNSSGTQRGRGAGGPNAEAMFAKVDSDGSGGVDATELQSMLDHVAEKSGQSLGDASTLLTQMDSDNDGSLSQSELGEGMKDLMPPPPDTLAFAQQRGMGGNSDDAAADLLAALDSDQSGEVSAGEMQTLIDQLAQTAGSANSSGSSTAPSGEDLVQALDSDGNGSLSSSELQALRSDSEGAAATSGAAPPQGAHGPHGAGGPPPARGGGGAASADSDESSSNSNSSTLDPLDTNEDGTVSMAERLAGQQAATASDGSAGSTDASGQLMDLAAMAADLLQRFSALAGHDSSGEGSSGFSALA